MIAGIFRHNAGISFDRDMTGQSALAWGIVFPLSRPGLPRRVGVPEKQGTPIATLLVLHGPNLNLLGTREPGVYGAVTLAQINQDLEQRAREAGHHLLHLQSNAEYELIERIHAARSEASISS